MSDFDSPSKNVPSIMGWADTPDPAAGEGHTASTGALTFGSPNFKMLPEPLLSSPR